MKKTGLIYEPPRFAPIFRIPMRFRVVFVKIILHQKSSMNATLETTACRRMAGNNRSGRWFLAFLGLSIAIIGAIFVWLLARSFLRAREMRNWPQVECVILVSEMQERIHDPQSPREYRHSLNFGYEWQGEALTGDHLTLRGSPWSSKREIIEKRVAEHPVGMTTRCRVDPQAPNFAVLKPDSLAPGYSIWFPGLFVIGGLGIAIRSIIPQKKLADI